MKIITRKLKKGAGLIGPALVLVWLIGVTGCTSTSLGNNALDRDYSNSVHNNLAQMVVDPTAGLKDNPTPGLYPKAASAGLDQYYKSFTGEKKATEVKLISSF